MDHNPPHRRTGRARGQAGFTLIELLASITILLALSSVVILAIGSARENTRRAACETEKSSVKTAIAAARIANLVAVTPADPSDYLESDKNPGFYSWTGSAPATWEVTALTAYTC